MRIDGLRGLKAKFKALRQGKDKQMEEALLLGGLVIQAESQKQTPVDTGALRNSHRTVKVSSSKGVRVEVRCQTAYAIFVHERMDVFHHVGNAKFLENAAREKRREVFDILEAKLKQ